MEKEQFKRVQRTFNYTPASIFTNQWSNIAFGAVSYTHLTLPTNSLV